MKHVLILQFSDLHAHEKVGARFGLMFRGNKTMTRSGLGLGQIRGCLFKGKLKTVVFVLHVREERERESMSQF